MLSIGDGTYISNDSMDTESASFFSLKKNKTDNNNKTRK